MKTLLVVSILGALAMAGNGRAQEAPKAEQAKPAPEPKAAEKAEEPKPAEKPAEAAPEKGFRAEFEVGARWNQGIHGNLDTYRSIVNMGEGPRLMSWDAKLDKSPVNWLNRATFRGAGWGGDPAAWIQFAAEHKLYRLTADHRSTAYFNSLPSFANPLLDRGLFVSQRSFDTRRKMTELQLDLNPSGRFIPYFGYTRDTGFGRGVSNFVSDANEYPVLTNLNDRTNLARGGLRMEFRRLHATIEQGGILFDDDQNLQTADRNSGNLGRPFLGQNLFLSNLLQAYQVSGSSLFTKGLLTAQPVSWLDISGALQFSQPRNDVTYSQTNQGLFVDLESLLFFNTQNLRLLSASKQPHLTASLGLELRPLHRFRIVQSTLTDRLHNASAIADTAFADRLEWNYSQHQVEAIGELTQRISLRGGYRYTWGDSFARAPFLSFQTRERAELVRHSALVGAGWRLTDKASLNADTEITRSDRVLFRTSLSDYEKIRVRGRYQLLNDLRLYGSFQYLNNSNPPALNPYEFRSQQTALGLQWLPLGGKTITLMGEYGRSAIRSDLQFRDPLSSTLARSLYRENAHTVTGLLTWKMAVGWTWQPQLSMGGSMFLSSGSRAMGYYQPVVRFTSPLLAHVDLFAEYRWYGVSQTFYAFEGFRSHQGVVGVRIH